MSDPETPKTHGTLPPETALSLLSNEVRATILWTLSEARGGEGPPPAIPFSELQNRASLNIDSSRFNYHLQQLVGTYVERIEATKSEDYDNRLIPEMAGWPGEGFRLTSEGTTLIRLIRAWSAADDASLAGVKIDQHCYECDTSLKAHYQNAVFAIQCPNCKYLYEYNLTPPGILDDDTTAVLRRVSEYNRHIRLGFARGICPYCANNVHAEFQDPSNTGYPRGDLREALVVRGCDHCGNKDNLTVGEILLREGSLISFCMTHGLDVTTTPIWELEFASTDHYTTVRSTEPWEVAVAVELDGDRLELVVDEDLTVVERTRF